jgi:tRNA pseudouridine55 synthase
MAPATEGLLLVDKPPGVTSHDVVDAERRALGTRRIGHAGTLDPMATGLLLLGVGRATRLLRYFGDLAKSYVGTARLGEETDTLDAEGAIVRTAIVSVTRAEVERACAALVGASMQTPPAYSSVKVGGRKLYEATRAGERIDAPARPVRVDVFDVSAFDGRDVAFSVACSGGTYVRALVADVGRSLGCGAHLRALRRTEIGSFRVEDAAAPGDAELLPIERAVAHLPRIELEPAEARAASNGSILGPAGIPGPYGVFELGGRLIGVYRDDGPKARPEVVLATVDAVAKDPTDR